MKESKWRQNCHCTVTVCNTDFVSLAAGNYDTSCKLKIVVVPNPLKHSAKIVFQSRCNPFCGIHESGRYFCESLFIQSNTFYAIATITENQTLFL